MLGKCTLPKSSTRRKQRGEETLGDHVDGGRGDGGGHRDGEKGGEEAQGDHLAGGGEDGDGAGNACKRGGG